MKISLGKNAAFIVGFVIFLLAFSYVELTYTRRVTGTSMLPTLEEGDMVGVEKVPFSDIRVGDIIVYDPPCSNTGQSVIHRVVEIVSGGLVTKGDNNPVPDMSSTPPIARGPITPDCYVGKVVFVVPYLERLADIPYGVNYVIAALIIVYIFYSELVDRNRKDEASNGKPIPAQVKGAFLMGEKASPSQSDTTRLRALYTL
jgi:signal peptidase I